MNYDFSVIFIRHQSRNLMHVGFKCCVFNIQIGILMSLHYGVSLQLHRCQQVCCLNISWCDFLRSLKNDAV